jgi:hypothetical protein
MVRSSILILLFSFALPIFSTGQSVPNIINTIKKEIRIIDIDSSKQKVTLENEEFMKDMPDGGGMMTGYFKNEQVRKIYMWVGLSYGTEINEFYFMNNQLMFVYEQFHAFPLVKSSGEFDYTRTEITFDGRYYFYHNKIISKVTKGHRHFEENTADPARRLLTEAKKDVIMLEKKKLM